MPTGHFEREARLQWLIPGSFLAIGLLTTLLATMCQPALHAARIDQCMDAGGRYDHGADRCIGAADAGGATRPAAPDPAAR